MEKSLLRFLRIDIYDLFCLFQKSQAFKRPMVPR